MERRTLMKRLLGEMKTCSKVRLPLWKVRTVITEINLKTTVNASFVISSEYREH